MSHRATRFATAGALFTALFLIGCGSSGDTADAGKGAPTAEKPKATFTNVVMSDDEATEAAKDSFSKETPKIFAFYKATGLAGGDKLKGVWICEKSDVAPENYKIDEITLNVEPNDNDGNFSLSKPTAGWPVGSYRVELYINDKLDHTAKFSVK